MKIDKVIKDIAASLNIAVEIKGDRVIMSAGDFITMGAKIGGNVKGKEKPDKATPDLILEILEGFEEGASMDEIRGVLKKDHNLDSSPAEIRTILSALETDEKIESEGKARGKKYMLAEE